MGRYKGLAGFSGRMVQPPERIYGILFGPPGAGKSCFFLDNESAYIFNLDRTSTTHPNPKAEIWPGLSESGELLGTSSPGILSFDDVLAQVDALERLAKSGEERPATIVFDSLHSLLSLIVAWVPGNAHQLGLSREPVRNWKDLHGPAAWDETYKLITGIPLRLRNAGYGVWYVSHLVNRRIRIGDDVEFDPRLQITDNLYARLYPDVEMVAYIHKEEVQEIVEKPIVHTHPKTGERIQKIKRESQSRVVHRFTVEAPGLYDILKARVPITPMFELPREGGWQRFREEYQAALEKDSPNE